MPPFRASYEEDEHTQLRATARAFIEAHVLPHLPEWNRAGAVDRSFYTAAAESGLIGYEIPEEFGGAGISDYRFSAVVCEEFAHAGAHSVAMCVSLTNDLCLPYILELADDEQKARWLPGIASGNIIPAIAMTEPGTGSDLAGIKTSARLDGDHYIVDGSKTFISSGQNADLVLTVVRTSPDPHKGLSVLAIERGTEGFERGRNLDKIGLHAQDTSELSFVGARVPASNLIGQEGEGFRYLMRNLPQERLGIAVFAVAGAEGTVERTLDYMRQRKAFGKTIGSFQNSRFLMAELTTEIHIARIYLDDCIRRHARGELTTVQASEAKWWCTDLQVRVTDRCLQMHGGYGYMSEYQVSQDFTDARVQTIYGGTNEIMKEIIGRSLAL